MKVLLILDNLSLESGISSIVLNLYKNMNSSMFDFLIFRDSIHSAKSEVESKGSKVYVLPSPLSPKSFFKAIKQLKDFFRNHSSEYDIVHLHSPTINEFTLKYAKKYGIPHRIVHSHSTMTSPNPIKKIINKFLLYNITTYANHFWSCSQEAAEFLFGKVFCEENSVEWIRNAVDTELYTFNSDARITIRNKLGLADKKVMCHVSNFSPIKNVSFLINVIREVCNLENKSRFIFVGDGKTRKEFQACLKTEKLEQYVIFTGFSDHVYDYLNCSDIFLLPSLKEGLPVVAIEAQANGLHCILHNTITSDADLGNVEYLPLVNHDWVKAICQYKTPSTSERITASHAIAKSEFNIKIEAQRIETLYLSLEKTERQI